MSRKVLEIDPKSSEAVRFSDFVFFPKSKQLQSIDGRSIGLRSQSMEVLSQLAARPGELLQKMP